MKRALSHVGGATTLSGDPEAGARLADALDVPTALENEDLARAHVHGFHSYPARMHPRTAQALVEAFSRPGEVVLDPFCGSGTVLVEARLAGRGAVGVDANPIAVRLARLKITPTTEPWRARLVEAAREVAAFADARRKAKAGPTKRYGPHDVGMFHAHVLLEVDGLRAGLDALPDVATREALELVLSSILTKLSRRESDTSGQAQDKRLAAGYPARLFVRKTEELCARLGEVTEALAPPPAPRRGPAPRPPVSLVLEGDARELEGVPDGSIALAVTSPPYPGNYDYLEHHAARLRWLRLRPGRFDRAEIGARRHLDPLGAREGLARFREDMAAVLRAVRRTLVPDGAAVLLIADSVVAASPVYAVDLLRAVAPESGFVVQAVASQPRPHFHAGTARAFSRRPRGEHAVLLRAISPAPRTTPDPRAPSAEASPDLRAARDERALRGQTRALPLPVGPEAGARDRRTHEGPPGPRDRRRR